MSTFQVSSPSPLIVFWGGSIEGPPFDFERIEDVDEPSGISVVHVGISPIQEA